MYLKSAVADRTLSVGMPTKTCDFICHISDTGQCELGLGEYKSLQPAAAFVVMEHQAQNLIGYQFKSGKDNSFGTKKQYDILQ